MAADTSSPGAISVPRPPSARERIAVSAGPVCDGRGSGLRR